MKVLKRAQEPEGTRACYSIPVPSAVAGVAQVEGGNVCPKTQQQRRRALALP